MGVSFGSEMSSVRTFTTLLIATVCLAVVSGQADQCSESEFEAPHNEWSASCVARFLTHIGLRNKADVFFANGVEGHALKSWNETALEAMNITKTSDQQNLLENIALL